MYYTVDNTNAGARVDADLSHLLQFLGSERFHEIYHFHGT